jgi:UDP-N-acetylglucosamine 2-epimerase (non-hydrolysing)
MKILVPLGTRPEIIKLASVVRALGKRGFRIRTVATGQHYDPSLTTVFYEGLDLQPAAIWDVEGDEADRVSQILRLAYREVAQERPDLVLLLGDTHTVPLFCLAARRHRVPVAHIEAGLRSLNETSIEEVNRRIAATTGSLHFAPTQLAARFLAAEGVPEERIRVVGNPGVDAIKASGIGRRMPSERSGAVVTAHRATNVDDPTRLENLVQLILRLAQEVGPVTFPVHPRTRARLEQSEALARLEVDGVHLIEPVPYSEMLSMIAAAKLVVTDSGGLQEEASWFGVPVIVLRRSTPRWEGVAAGLSVLVGLDVERAVDAAVRLTLSEEQERVMALPSLFGDGNSGERIAGVLDEPGTAALLRIAEPDLVGKPPPGAVEAVLFDLDDTLFAQQGWLAGAWEAVAEAGVSHGADASTLREALVAAAAEGSDRGGIIDRALASVGAAGIPVSPLVEAFRSFEADALEPYPGVHEALAALSRRIPIGLVTDGDVRIQRSKLRALGLEHLFDTVIFSDELGRHYRKPSSEPFRAALAALGVEPERAIFVGDHPKDVAGAAVAGMRAIRVRSGEHRGAPDGVKPWATVDGVVEAIAIVEGLAYNPARRAVAKAGVLGTSAAVS